MPTQFPNLLIRVLSREVFLLRPSPQPFLSSPLFSSPILLLRSSPSDPDVLLQSHSSPAPVLSFRLKSSYPAASPLHPSPVLSYVPSPPFQSLISLVQSSVLSSSLSISLHTPVLSSNHRSSPFVPCPLLQFTVCSFSPHPLLQSPILSYSPKSPLSSSLLFSPSVHCYFSFPILSSISSPLQQPPVFLFILQSPILSNYLLSSLSVPTPFLHPSVLSFTPHPSRSKSLHTLAMSSTSLFLSCSTHSSSADYYLPPPALCLP